MTLFDYIYPCTRTAKNRRQGRLSPLVETTYECQQLKVHLNKARLNKATLRDS